MATGAPAQVPANTELQGLRPSSAPICTSSKGGPCRAGWLSSRFSAAAAPLPCCCTCGIGQRPLTSRA